MRRLALRHPRNVPAPRAPIDLAARVTERARLMRERPAIRGLDIMGDPLPGRSALDRRIEALDAPSRWVRTGRISAARMEDEQ